MSHGVELAFKGDTFLGFMAALGVLRLLGRGAPAARLAWGRDRRARLTGRAREEILALVQEALAGAEYEPERALNLEGKRLPWDLCAGGRAPLNFAIPEIIEDLRAQPQKVERAVFGPWVWQDAKDPLGWVPSLRDHALRPRAPTRDKSFRENGAVWLAWEGIPAFGRIDDKAVGWQHEEGGKQILYWPLWSAPATFRTIRSLLRATPRPNVDLGVFERWSTYRAHTGGKAMVLTVPKPVNLGRPAS